MKKELPDGGGDEAEHLSVKAWELELSEVRKLASELDALLLKLTETVEGNRRAQGN